jgi:hypothetical protein
MVMVSFVIIISEFLFRRKQGIVHSPLPQRHLPAQTLGRAFNMFQELPVDEENTMDSHIPYFHKGHRELKERLCQLEKIVDLSPLNIADFELRIVVIFAIPVKTIPQFSSSAKH